MNKKKKKKYWYLYYHDECVLCGCGGTTKVRIYDRPKPIDPRDRHEYRQDACGSHFL